MPGSLDPLQREAVEHGKGPALVWAGAGTGKTLALVKRVARLLQEGIATPDELLVITYTRSAAEELRQRIACELPGMDDKPLGDTFHGFCYELLQQSNAGFKVLDEKDLWIYLRRHIGELPLRRFIKAANLGQFLDDLLKFFARCHDELIAPQRYLEFLERAEKEDLPLPRVSPSKQKDELPREEAMARCREIAETFQKIEAMLRAENLGTFGHMVTRAVELLERAPEALARARRRARWILLDEFQDANHAQIHLCRLLAGVEENIFAVGDPDQGIYQFRGASGAAFQEFLRAFPAAKQISFRRSHRSLEPILQCAYAVVSINPEAVSAASSSQMVRQPLLSVRSESLDKEAALVDIALAKTHESEAAHVAEGIERMRANEGCSWREFAVLYRSHANRNALCAELAQRRIPFSVAGVDIFDTPELRDALSALRILADPKDSVAWLRLAALPQFEIAEPEIRRALRASGPLDGLQSFVAGAIVVAKAQELKKLSASANFDCLASFDAACAVFQLPANGDVLRALRGFIEQWREKPLTERGTVAEFLEYLEFFAEARGSVTITLGEGTDAVQLRTVHAAKGLEYCHVFVLRAHTQSFPLNFREPLFEFPAALHPEGAGAAAESGELHEQEERRLFYVAMTRARDSLSICAKSGRGKKDPTPPGFLRELMQAEAARPYWRETHVPEPGIAIAAAAEPASRLQEWLYADVPAAARIQELSATAIETYKRCPLQYKLEREWQLPTAPSAALQFGDAMHRALKLFGERVAEGFRVSADEMIACFDDAFSAAVIEDVLQRALYEKQGRQQLQIFHAAHSVSPPPVIAAEKSFVFELGACKVRGRIDRIDRIEQARVTITDYKTGASKTQEHADKSLQLSLYSLAARELWGYAPERLVFYNLETAAEVVTTRSQQELQEVTKNVQEVATGIAAGEFPPTPGHHCRWCAYREVCPTQEERLYTIDTLAVAAGKAQG